MRLRTCLYLLVAFPVLAVTPLPALAQDTGDGADRRSVRATIGVVAQSGIFGDDDPRHSSRQLSPTVSVGIRRHPARVIGLAFETAFEPRPISNPHFDESVTRVFMQLGPEIGRRVYVRPTAGGSINLWTGTGNSQGLALTPGFAVAAGYRHTTRSRARVHPEVVARVSVEIGAVTWSAGAQIGVNLPNW
jgi:hypothetical protein